MPAIEDAPGPATPDPEIQAGPILGANILVAEDNEFNQLLVRELLENAGAVVTLVNNGREAVEVLNEMGPFDLVLMDVRMPVLDGIAATREIRANRTFEAMPIIAMTANVMADDRERTAQAGMQAHLDKPIDFAELYRTLERWIPPRKARSDD